MRTAALALAVWALAAFASPVAAQPAAPVTFARDVAPIVYAKCGVCHRPGGAGPFSLISYADARVHARQIATVTKSGYMPPWQADGDYGGEFLNQPRLTPVELDVLQRWGADGALEGNAADTPAPPQWTDGWQLGTPDLVVTTPKFTLQADGTDVFRVFVIKLPVDNLKFVRGMEFKPGNARVVHHANIRIDHTDASRKFDEADPEPGYTGLIANSAIYPDGHFLGWTPAQVPPLLPKGLAWRLQPNTDLVVELHMQPSGKEEVVQPTIGFYFGSDPPERTPAMLRLGRQSIDIPPGENSYVITDSFVTPVDIEVQAVQPHAHYRAKEMVGFANLPDGSVRPLIHIRDWDFRWQHVFRYVTPFWLPKGTRLQMRYSYDNSAENPRNPNQPPERVYWGQRSADEMGDLWIQVLTRNEQDLQTLNAQFGPKVVTEDTAAQQRCPAVSRPEPAAGRRAAFPGCGAPRARVRGGALQPGHRAHRGGRLRVGDARISASADPEEGLRAGAQQPGEPPAGDREGGRGAAAPERGDQARPEQRAGALQRGHCLTASVEAGRCHRASEAGGAAGSRCGGCARRPGVAAGGDTAGRAPRFGPGPSTGRACGDLDEPQGCRGA